MKKLSMLHAGAQPRWNSLWTVLEPCRICFKGAFVKPVVWTGQKRGFATPSRDDLVERLNITCGSSGSITIDLYNSQALNKPTSPLIIYLPPTGTHLKSHHPSIPPYLFGPSAALASINYRWNIPSTSSSSSNPLSSHPSYAKHAFPTPLHDTLHAYTYLTSTFLALFQPKPIQPSTPPPRWQSNPPSQQPKQPPRPVLIYGSYLGGTLATSLALTESFIAKNRGTYTIGLIAQNAILDWTEIATTQAPDPLETPEEEHQDTDQLIRSTKPWTASTLHTLKEKLFKNPASCFDSFASPILFFHSAGVLPPPTWVLDVDEHDLVLSDPLRVDVSLTSDFGSVSDYEEVEVNLPEGWSSSSSAASSTIITLPSTPPPSPDSLIPPPMPIQLPERPLQQQQQQQQQPQPAGKRTTSVFLIQTTRAAHQKYPPKDSGLRIPRTLFLTTSPPSPSLSPSPSTPKPKPQSKSKSKSSSASSSAPSSASASTSARSTSSSSALKKALKAKMKAQEKLSPRGQAEELARLMRRSIVLHEFGERTMWDSDVDPVGVGEERVRVAVLGVGDKAGDESGNGSSSGEEAEGDEVVREWVSDLLDRYT